MRASSYSLKRGLGVPKVGEKTKARKTVINRLRDLVKLRPLSETAKFRLNVICVSAQNT